MSAKSFRSSDETKKRLNNPVNNQFIQKVSEEDRRDKILKDVFMRSTEENPYSRQVKSAVQLCSEIKEDARQRFLEEKRRQQLRENNQELKQLEVQLRTAYVKKAIAAQIFEQEALKEQRIAEDYQCNLELEKARMKKDEAARKQDEEKRAKSVALKTDLQEQIAMSNATRLAKYEDLLKEKEAIDNVVRKCMEDQLKEEREAAERKIKAKAEMEDFKRAQEEWKAAQTLASDSENEKIKELLRQRDLELQRAKDEKLKERLRKEQISDKIGQKIHAIQTEEEKIRANLVELLIDERQAKDELELREKLEKEKRERIAIASQLERDREEKERRKMEEKKLEEEFLKEEMRILAERDKLDQMSDERRRKKQIEQRRELKEALNKKKRLKAEQMKEFLTAREEDLKKAQREQELVEEERIRMIKQHASGLMGFLAPGVLRESDRKHIPIPPK